MTRRLPVEPAPGPLEGYAARCFDDLFRARAQREGSRRYLQGLLLPAERNKTLTALAKTPSRWPEHSEGKRRACTLVPLRVRVGPEKEVINERRLELLFEERASAPSGKGALVIDEHGDRKWGKHTPPTSVGNGWPTSR